MNRLRSEDPGPGGPPRADMWKQGDIGQNIDDQSGNRFRNQQVCFLAEQCRNFEHEIQAKDKEPQKYDRHQVAGSTVRIGS